jgi:hypothetical protein
MDEANLLYSGGTGYWNRIDSAKWKERIFAPGTAAITR